MLVSLVVLTRDEEPTVGSVVEGARPHVGEILVVDGHSRDRTREVAAQLGARVVLDSGRGKGAAMRQAIHEVSGELIVFIDADGSHDPADIPRLVEPIASGNADMVIGSRFKGGSDELVGNLNQFFRMTGSNVITTFINYRWGVRLTDTQNGFRAVRTDVARQLQLAEDGFPIETEMDMEVLRRGFRIAEVPSHEHRRAAGESKIVLWRVWWQYPLILLRALLKPKYL